MNAGHWFCNRCDDVVFPRCVPTNRAGLHECGVCHTLNLVWVDTTPRRQPPQKVSRLNRRTFKQVNDELAALLFAAMRKAAQ